MIIVIKMKYIESPEYFFKTNEKTIFLAGGITNCPNWQSDMANLLKIYDIVLLNPRRKNFPIDDPRASKEQIKWEFDHLRIADAILFWFPEESICPIALYELGAWCMTQKPVLVGVHPNYKRKKDIEEQTSLVRPDIKIVYSLDKLAKQISAFIG